MTAQMSVTAGKDSKDRVISSPTHSKLRQFSVGVVASFNGLIWGLVIGYSSPAVDSFITDGFMPFYLSDSLKSLIGSIPNAGAVVGNAISGPVTARLGRRRIFQLAMLPQILAWVLLGFSRNPAMALTARVIQGALADFWGPVAQLYAAEIAHPDLRDSIGALTMFELATGMFLGYAIGGCLRWDHMAFLVAGFLTLLWPLTFLLPESPVYLLSKDRVDEARVALQWLRGPGYNSDEELETLRLNQSANHKADQFSSDDKKKTSFKDLFTPATMKPLMLVLLLLTLRQWTGPYAVYTFVVEIFQLSGSSANPHASSMIVGAMTLVFQFLAVGAVRRFGKKRLGVMSAAFLFAGHFGVGFYFYLVESGAGVSGGLNYLPLISMCVTLMGFNLGLCSFPFVLMGELLPEKIRDTAAGLCFSWNCIMAFIVVETFYPMTRGIRISGTFGVYCVVSLITALVIIFCAPNTQGKSLAELQNSFDAGPPKKNAVYPEDSFKNIVIVVTNNAVNKSKEAAKSAEKESNDHNLVNVAG
ncbi:unnamed protein product [Notodromas monacha]|uniref:Major facilitator superfamily (MFS) profile domain-containing protein n=1 Tax=Notodromas monacha TaxID=399045 RepID=A0A7R9BP00_9CRUS|nr:unnamed protein product [Notodromas monacha]CAG0919035.1 unnamed protein product [Notodromas monacha]